MKAKFTLIELLTVVAILGILAGLILMAVKKTSESSRKTYCANNLRQLGLLLTQYANDYGGRFPIAYRIAETPDEEYSIFNIIKTDNPDIFKCPSDIEKKYEGMTFWEKHASSYEWEPWFNGRKIERIKFEITGAEYLTPLMLDAEAFHGKNGRNYLYADGRVKGKMEDPLQ